MTRGAGRILLFSSTVVAFFNGFKPSCNALASTQFRTSGVRLARVDNSSLTLLHSLAGLSDLRERRDGCVAPIRAWRIIPESGRAIEEN